MKFLLVIFVVFALSFMGNSAIQQEALNMPQKYPVIQEQTEPQEKTIMVLSEGRILLINQNGELLKTIGIKDSVQDFAWYTEDTLVYTNIVNGDLKISKFCLVTESSKTVVVLRRDNVCRIGECPVRRGRADVPFWYLTSFHSPYFEQAIKIDNHYLFLQADNRVVENEIIDSYLFYKIDLDDGTFKMHDIRCTHSKVSREETTPPKSPKYFNEKHKKRSEKVLNSLDRTKYPNLSEGYALHLSPVNDYLYYFHELGGAGAYSYCGSMYAIDLVSGKSLELDEEPLWDLRTFRFSFPQDLIYWYHETLYKKKDGVDKFTPVTQKFASVDMS